MAITLYLKVSWLFLLIEVFRNWLESWEIFWQYRLELALNAAGNLSAKNAY